MKQILIDIYKANNPYSGLGQFSINFHKALIDLQGMESAISFLAPKSFEGRSSKYHYHNISAKHRYLPHFSPAVDIWHSLHQFPSHQPNPKSKQILTVHDLNFLSQKRGAKVEKYLKRLQKNVDRAEVLTAISHFTKSEMEKSLDLKGKQIHVIHNGVALCAFTDALKPDYISNRPFFFSIGIFSEKKNFEVLLPLMEKFPDYQLVLAGDHNTSYGNSIKEQIGTLGLTDRVVLPGKIADAEKYYLYSHAEAFLFPSLAEGFGLPVIEAFLAGTPAFISRSSSLPEIGGDHAFYFNSFDPVEMQKNIEAGLHIVGEDRDAFSQKLKAYGNTFSWENAIEKYVALYKSLY